MSVSIYNNLNFTSLDSGIGLAWLDHSHKVGVDYGVSGNRLYKCMDGSLRIATKTPCEVAGERILRPLLDKTIDWSSYTLKVLKRGLSLVDNILSLNFLPVADAAGSSTSTQSQTTLEKCLAQPLELTVRATEIGIKTQDPKMLLAAHQTYDLFFQKCFQAESYEIIEKQFEANNNFHNKKVKEYEDALKKCEKENGDTYCGPYSQREEYKPEMFEIDTVNDVNGQAITTKKWTTTQGYLSWSIHIYRAYWFNIPFQIGGYNYDTTRNRPTISTREELIRSSHSP
ncbi:MAG: hypothetical protein H0W88_01145 [Parachlamydiaceae bacterium]|nr:hypothetical protein [Parachlamydiaceae bacterium]